MIRKTLLLVPFLLIAIIFFHSWGYSNPSLEEHVVPYSLKNGMKFLLVKRVGAPVFSAYIRVKVGGVDEKEGQTGIAHMLEHMAFKGTKKIGTKNYAQEKLIIDQIEKKGIQFSELVKGGKENSNEAKELKLQMKALQKSADLYSVKDEFSRTFIQNGATNFNATTSMDMTSYFVEMPINKLELWAYLESEALKDPVFREFYQERDVVLEERRMRVDDSPFGKNYESFISIAYQLSPYRRPTIGYEKDIKGLTATDLYEFYKKYYLPQNMIGSIVGDIDIDQTKKILEEYFGSIPAGKIPSAPKNLEPSQKEEKREVIRGKVRPQIMIGYHKPTLPDRDDYVFDLIDQILCDGRTSRFEQELVEKQKIAQSVSCDTGTPGGRLNNLFFIYATPIGSNSAEKLEQAIEAEIEKIKTNLVSSEELERAKNQLIADLTFKISTNLGLAETLTYYEILAGDWHYLDQHPKIAESITAAEIRAVAKKYFTKENRVVSILE